MLYVTWHVSRVRDNKSSGSIKHLDTSVKCRDSREAGAEQLLGEHECLVVS